MITRRAMASIAFVALFVPNSLWAQQHTARDSFWSSSDLITVAPNPAVHKQAVSRPTTRQNQSAVKNSSDSSQSQRGNQIAQLVAMNGYGSAPTLVRTAESRLGLRCSIMLRGTDGQYNEVTPGTVFHSGDHIRLSFLANHAGYFYVIQKGSTGAWSPIFPPPNSAAEANKVSAGQMQTVPSGTKSFAFDQNAGDEKLYVILSRTPIPDIDRSIQNLKNNQPAASPQSQHEPDSGAMVEAQNHIPDVFMKGIASRDLKLVDEEKVDDSSKGNMQGEKAIYVVSKESRAETGTEVVLSLDLRHE